MTPEEFIRTATELPVFPGLVTRLIAATNDASISATEISEIVEADQSMSARLLKLANSTFYGRRGRVATVRHAVVVLGNKTIRSLAVTIWTHAIRGRTRGARDAGLSGMLFQHGLACAVCSELLVARFDSSLEEDAFMAGLLHDIGRLAFVCNMGTAYAQRILNPAADEIAPITELERTVMGFDHAQLGGVLLRSWGLPEILCHTAEEHHVLAIDPTSNPLLGAVALGNHLATQMELNVALTAPRPFRSDLETAFGIVEPADRTAFCDFCKGRVSSLLEALR